MCEGDDGEQEGEDPMDVLRVVSVTPIRVSLEENVSHAAIYSLDVQHA